MALYDRYAFLACSIAAHVLADNAAAEEVVQDVFLEIWQNARTFNPDKGRGLSWMMTIARRRSIDRVRASQASRERDLMVGIRDRATEFDSVSETVEVTLEHERAVRAMGRVTAVQRETLNLAYFEGLSCQEIAHRLGVKLSTVKTRLRDGLIRLRAELEGEPA